MKIIYIAFYLPCLFRLLVSLLRVRCLVRRWSSLERHSSTPSLMAFLGWPGPKSPSIMCCQCLTTWSISRSSINPCLVSTWTGKWRLSWKDSHLLPLPIHPSGPPLWRWEERKERIFTFSTLHVYICTMVVAHWPIRLLYGWWLNRFFTWHYLNYVLVLRMTYIETWSILGI